MNIDTGLPEIDEIVQLLREATTHLHMVDAESPASFPTGDSALRT